MAIDGIDGHRIAGFTPPRGKTTLAYAPHCPVAREERWYVVLADSPKNAVLVWAPVTLMEAEKLGIAQAQSQNGTSGENKTNGGDHWPMLRFS